MRYLKFNIKVLTVTAGLLISISHHGNAFAEDNASASFPNENSSVTRSTTPDKKPPIIFQEIGVVRQINLAERTIEISGKKYIYGIDIKVHSYDSGSISIASLSPNTKIGYRTADDKSKRKILQEIWVLPKSIFNAMPTDM